MSVKIKDKLRFSLASVQNLVLLVNAIPKKDELHALVAVPKLLGNSPRRLKALVRL